MPTPDAVATDDVVLAADVNQYKNLLEGASTYTATYALVSTASTNFVIKLGDAAAANKLSIQDSGGVEVAYINSDGAFSGSINLAAGTMVLPTAASPTPTTEGQIYWDTDDNLASVGDGAASKLLIPTPTTTAGDLEYASGARAHSRLAIGTADQILAVNSGATAPSWVSGVDGAVKGAFRTGRKLLGEYTGGLFQADSTSTFFNPNGIGYSFTTTNGNMATVDGPEPSVSINGNNAGASHFFGSTDAVSGIQTTLVTTPAKNPRMLLRWLPGEAHANMTTIIAGFVQGTITSTIGGAYLRANTTGNLFFVTRQGGAETTTDLGARPSVLTSYEIYTEDAGVTWICRNDTTGTVVATHTGDVPTAATNIGFGAGVIISAQIVAPILNLGYMRVDANFTP